jgi:transposase
VTCRRQAGGSTRPYDPEATYGNKRSTAWTGYKVHLTETCQDDEVDLVTNVETTVAVAADVDQTAPIHTALAAKGLLPRAHLVDAGYVDAELPVGSQTEHEVRLVGPVRCVRMPVGRPRRARASTSATF